MTVRDNEPGMPDAPQERSSQTRSARRKPPPKDQPPRGDGGAPEQDASSADAALAPTRESSPIPAQWTISLGGPAHSSWREQALTRIADLRTRAEWFRASTEASAGADILTQAINGHLAAAQRAAEQPRSETGLRSVGIAFTGSEVERTMSNLEAA